LNRPEAARVALTAIDSIPRDDDGPVFPAPWAATAFAMTLLLHERGHFTWPQWAEHLGARIAGQTGAAADDPEAYWLCWLDALETVISDTDLAGESELQGLREAWRKAASATPHGEPIALSEQVKASLSR
jgi:nitrile hydratase accessory protein